MPLAIRAEIDIDAPIDRVWDILFDIDRYEEWNPFTPRVESTLRLGDPVTLHVQMRPNKRLVQVERVTGVEPGTTLCWGMTMVRPFLLAANRCQVLTERGGGTHYATCDEFRGVLVPLVKTLYGKDIQRGFDAVASALKARAEAG